MQKNTIYGICRLIFLITLCYFTFEAYSMRQTAPLACRLSLDAINHSYASLSTVDCSALTNQNFSCASLIPSPDPSLITVNNTDGFNVAITSTISDNGGMSCATNPLLITRTYTITFDDGNSETPDIVETCSQVFTIIDDTAPTLLSPATDMVVSCDGNGNIQEFTTWLNSNGGAEAMDNCSLSWTRQFDDLTTFCEQSNRRTVTFTATDNCGNTISTTANFTITNTTPPTLQSLAENNSVICNGSGNAVELQTWLNNNGGASAIDGCGGLVTWTNDFTTLSTINAGSTTVVFRASNDCGAFSETSATFTIQNVTPPVIDVAAENITLECGNTEGLNTWLQNNGGASATVFCSDQSTWTNNFTAIDLSCGDAGMAVVTFRVTNDSDLSAETTATVRFKDTTVPDILSPATDMTIECDGAGNTAALNAWLSNHGGATSTDVCSSQIVWSHDFTALSDDCGQTGSAVVTFRATDDCGLFSESTATFTIEDTSPPNITTPAIDMTVECDGVGNTAALNAWLNNHGGATSTDVCSGQIVWSNDFTALSDDCGQTGSTVVTFRATDDCGLFSESTATFTIEDTNPPNITTLATDMTVVCDGAGNLDELNAWLDNHAGAVSTDVCSGQIVWSHDFTTLSDDCGQTGSAVVTFRATDDCGLFSETTATFTIEDTTIPFISAVATDMTVACDGAGNLGELNAWLSNQAGAMSTNICSDQITWTNDFNAQNISCGIIPVTFRATNDCGLFSETMASFTIVDDIAPSINCPSAQVVEFGNSTAPGATGFASSSGDNCTSTNDMIISYTDVSTQEGTGFNSNNYIISRTWVAEDLCTNTTSCMQTITVEDTSPPVFDNPQGNIVLTAALGTCGAVANWSLFTATDNGSIASIICSTESGIFVAINSSIEVTCEAIDVSGNSSSHTFTVSVAYNTNTNIPLFYCPESQSISLEEGLTSSVVFWEEPSLDLSCSYLTLTSSAPSGSTFQEGTHLVTYTASEGNQLISSCNFLVQVYDPLTVACVDELEVTFSSVEANSSPIIWNVPSVISDCPECRDTDLNNFDYLGYFQGHQYFYSKIKKNWNSANAMANAHQAHLVSINSAAENNFLTGQMLHDKVYIGLTDHIEEGSLLWTHEDTFLGATDYQNVENNTNSGDYGILNDSGLWSLEAGNSPRYFIMERPCVDIEVLQTPPSNNLNEGTHSVSYAYRAICGGEEICTYPIQVISDEKVLACETGSLNTSRFWIEEVQLGNDNHYSNNEAGYTDFSADASFKLIEGESPHFSIRLNPDAPDLTYFIKVWIDWNGDGDFYDENEQVVTNTLAELNYPTINTDMSALNRTYKMRVQVSTQSDAAPCGYIEEGEVQDYRVSVLPKPDLNNNYNGSLRTASIFPNPSQGMVYLELAEASEAGTYLEVYNVTGQKVFQQAIPAHTIGTFKINIPTQQLENGYYQVKLIQPHQHSLVFPLIMTH